ncbi:C40 family peptidase [Marinirhabdus gelatinilytica]|uniref:Cell wall-associated NlpC family hydrolase n=1 Tax=Marinirhabdus gelatinilytica TaxID=1703343 RepID=A0A370QL36_9FLAO|nr:C40 family peptidase [Marinirhabdus gelatinilytica]RDK89085.1 cell wall-associated NlpC family hydrolase [Marinirhabdus gelatinilytica]
MKKLLPLLLLTLVLASCGSSRKTTTYKKNRSSKVVKSNVDPNSKAGKIIKYAKSFEGTRYKFGGTTKKGMDCSGLIYTSFANEGIALPRISRDMAKEGKRISLLKVKEGDLVFFQTNKSRNVINHVGLVVYNKSGVLKFIHSTTSRGVIISDISESYWNRSFVQARRII